MFSLTWDPMGAKIWNASYPSNHFWILSNFVWIFFSVILTKVLFWIFEILSFWFLTNFLISPLYPMGKPKTSIIWKTSDCKFGSPELVFSVHRVLLTLQWLRSFCGHLVHSDFRQACISKMAGRRAKQSEIWASGASIQCIQGPFDS